MSEDENKLIKRRIEKLEELKELGCEPYFNGFSPQHFLGDIAKEFETIDGEKLKELKTNFKISGRIISIRDFGKASFLKLKDFSGTLQVYCQKNLLDEQYTIYKKLDVGDIIGIEGNIFKTKTQEITINATKLFFLAKAIRPLPEKWHGLQDKELRYRQRYVDLIVNDEVRETFFKRSEIIANIRNFMIKNRFLEVETPMLHKLVGGAAAKPFATYLNALDMDMYLRIAPELYLKRLIVGGLDRVFEINRNFRNEGMDLKHNPEFTMMEFYCAYKEYNFLMNFTEGLFEYLLNQLKLNNKITYGTFEIDFSRPWKRIKFIDAIKEIGGLSEHILQDKSECLKIAKELDKKVDENTSHEKILAELFDALVEPKLINPTFIIEYPTDISPLARRNSQNPQVTDRFELFIGNMEIANGFSELNDPFDQKMRFIKQLEDRSNGDEEASMYDEDYICALEYGLPPTAGEGIGIDRLVMLLTNNQSIRDVILFPLMK